MSIIRISRNLGLGGFLQLLFFFLCHFNNVSAFLFLPTSTCFQKNSKPLLRKDHFVQPRLQKHSSSSSFASVFELSAQGGNGSEDMSNNNGDDDDKRIMDADQLLQAKLDKIVEEPPMFGAFNADNMSEESVPIPMFTASIVLVGSLIWTYYLFDIGINGFPKN